jgi:ADP-ribose pyrophosphatase YjhB (NUDIX family)
VYPALKRSAYRVAYRCLWALSFVRRPRGHGVKALLVNDGEVLLVTHTYGPREWELPGGGVRWHEEPLGALCRELREELGVAVEAATLLSGSGGPGRFAAIGVSYFRVDVAERAVIRDAIEIAEVAWFDPHDLPHPLGWHATKALARHGEAIASPERRHTS